MIKKFISFICCFLPIGALAYTVDPMPDPDDLSSFFSPSAGNTVTVNSVHIGDGEDLSLAIESGNGLTLDGIISESNNNSLYVFGSAYIGKDSANGPNNFYATTETDAVFTIKSAGNVDINGDLEIADGRTLNIEKNGNTSIKVTVNGNINAVAEADLEKDTGGKSNLNIIDGIKEVRLGALGVNGETNIQAEKVSIGAVSVKKDATAKIVSIGGDVLDILQLVTLGKSVELQSVAGIHIGKIQQWGEGQTVALSVGGDLIVDNGNVENSGTLMSILDANDINVGAGSIKNDSMDSVNNNGKMVIRAGGNLYVEGSEILDSDGNTKRVSIVNTGDFDAIISGNTTLVHGFDVTTMGTNGNFSLTTANLNLGTQTGLELKAGTVNLTITSGGMAFAGGVNNQGIINLSAKGNVGLSGINNTGNLTVLGGDNVDITGNVTAGGSGEMRIAATNDLTVSGNITNGDNVGQNQMVLTGGGTITLKSKIINNENAKLIVGASTDTNGTVVFNNSITNYGALDIFGRQLEIKDDLINNSGTISVTTSDRNNQAIKISNLTIDGGVVNLSALNGGIVSDGTVRVNENGALNLGSDTHLFDAVGAINIAGNFSLAGPSVTGGGDVNSSVSGANGIVFKSAESINIGGNVVATARDNARSATFDAKNISVGGSVGGDVFVDNKGKLVFGTSAEQNLNVSGKMDVVNGGVIDLYANATVASLKISSDSQMIVHDGQIIATGVDGIVIDGGLSLNSGVLAENGLVGRDDNTDLVLSSQNGNISIANGINILSTNSLHLDSAARTIISGNVYNSGIIDIESNNEANIAFIDGITNDTVFNGGDFTVASAIISVGDVINTGNVELVSTGGLIALGNIDNSNDFVVTGKHHVNANSIKSTGGVLEITTEIDNTEYLLNVAGDLSLLGGSATITSSKIYAENLKLSAENVELNTNDLIVTDKIDLTGGRVITTATNIDANILSVKGDISHDSADAQTSQLLKLIANNTDVNVTNLTVDGTVFVNKNNATYTIDNTAIIGGISVAEGANMDFSANSLQVKQKIENSGVLSLGATSKMDLGDVSMTSGEMTLDVLYGDKITANNVNISGGVLHLVDNFYAADFTAGGALYQNGVSFADGDIDIHSNDYVLSAGTMEFAAIKQSSGVLKLETSDLRVNGNIGDQEDTNKTIDLLISATDHKLTMDVSGYVSNGVRIDGLQQMDVGGNYYFDNNSMLNVNLMSNIGRDYWATVSLNDDDTLGEITNNNPTGGALIQVGGKFVSNITALGDEINDDVLPNGQMGIVLNDMVDPGTAIWLVHADNGLLELEMKIRNLYVSFCNEDGTKCFNLLPQTSDLNGTDGELPVYLSVRDIDNDGKQDSLYIVFDPRFGGPVNVFKIQPIVERTQNHTTGEYISAGALDNLIADALLYDAGFKKRTPIESLPIVFAGTNLETLMNELYERMEDYNTYREGGALSRFSRLVQPREIDQIISGVALNYHTLARDVEDHMFDEFIWNRNRKLEKAWFDADFGMYYNKDVDGRHIDGNRFSITGGYDWQESKTLIYGLFGHISHMAGADADDIDLSYQAYAKPIDGHIDVNVKNTDIAFGGYMVQTLAPWVRAYGQATMDIQLFDISRQQTYVNGDITGDGVGFGISTEWGILHDWLNQYIVGNAYVRMGYNFGTTITEQAAGSDYMDIKLDGYFMLTPGYSLTAQKRIYPSMWFQIRPYATIGIEYDVLGTPDAVDYKFAMADTYTEYDSTVDPLWANIGGGVEFLGAFGGQIGLDYRYQYNDTIQLHNIKVSGKYRF
ncbi:MAG: hypothetical protein MJ187_04355 [Alphaproteobacteria bacterium]|nr:hypothetical protein [Alphaproteobacteria bacterium]